MKELNHRVDQNRNAPKDEVVVLLQFRRERSFIQNPRQMGVHEVPRLNAADHFEIPFQSNALGRAWVHKNRSKLPTLDKAKHTWEENLRLHKSPLLNFRKLAYRWVQLLLEKLPISLTCGKLLKFSTPAESFDQNLMPNILVLKIIPENDLMRFGNR